MARVINYIKGVFKREHILSVDCGQQGAMCLDGKHFIDFKTLKHPKGMLDSNKLEKDLLELIGDKTLVQIIVEKQFNPSGKFQKGSWTNAMNYGVIMTIVHKHLKENTTLVELYPKEWQRFFNVLGASKARIAQVAVAHGFEETKLKTPRGRLLDGRTDAYCMWKQALLIQEEKKRIGI